MSKRPLTVSACGDCPGLNGPDRPYNGFWATEEPEQRVTCSRCDRPMTFVRIIRSDLPTVEALRRWVARNVGEGFILDKETLEALDE